MKTPINQLPIKNAEEFFKDLNYLNLKEVQTFCNLHRIPYCIHIETESGKLRKTTDRDRKAIVLKRIRDFLKSGAIPKGTVLSKDVVRLSGLPKELSPTDRIYYGCYDKKNPKMISLLKKLTNGRFRNGAVARILLRKYWTGGTAPTFQEFAREWTKAVTEYSLNNHPEAAYLSDRSKGFSGSWKEFRNQKARFVMELLNLLNKPKT